MKKIFIIAALVFSIQFSFSQNEAFKADVMKLIEKSGANGSMDSAKKQIFNMIPEESQAAFSKDFDATLPKLYDKLAVVYMEIYTHQDIKDLLKFYETPIGKKMSSNTGLLMEKSMAIGSQWGQDELQAIVQKYMKQ
ncbi:DUF2059 domain-containing protein [Flavobacterium terrigena]|uniref:DUF2059 domain-containing protein n=1 Tax=Flavobacterium terrigena TaxID=402734 RepID=A0A1H6WWQ8_9FLAO|nr:DUF2059 domain-containing protein [Flavobacterium terrigena]SEJ16775.1 hypothetical protein SAMN05660918_2519 [Flavobacterium terrigena]